MRRHVGAASAPRWSCTRLSQSLFLLLGFLSGPALADGKMYWREKVPPSIPYQRALILFRDGSETLILQSKYELPKAGEQNVIGWVVPVPAAPELASLPADDASWLFWKLSLLTEPRVTRIRGILIPALAAGIGSLAIVVLVLCLLSYPVGHFRPLSPRARQIRDFAETWALRGFALSLIVLFYSWMTPTLGRPRSVEVVNAQRVGIYDVSVLRATDAQALTTWLGAHELYFGPEDTTAFAAYVAKGWCFTVALLNPTADQKLNEVVREGLAAPLILRFPVAAPVYPVVLTGTGGYDTEMLIYLASDRKMTAGGRLTLRYAGISESGIPTWPFAKTQPLEFFPDSFFDAKVPLYPWLCKFKERLTPAQMRQDIVFTPDLDPSPYREHRVQW